MLGPVPGRLVAGMVEARGTKGVDKDQRETKCVFGIGKLFVGAVSVRMRRCADRRRSFICG